MKMHLNLTFKIMVSSILLVLSSFLLACGKTQQEPEKDLTPTGIMVPMVTFQEVRLDIQGMDEDSYCWIEDSIYYSEWEKVEEGSFPRHTIYKEAVDGSTEKEAIDVKDARLIYVLFTDGAGNLGFIAGESADTEREYFLIREDLTGQEISRAPLELREDPTNIREGAMDPEGNILYVTYSGKAYLLNSEGKSLGITELGMTQPKILNCGEQGIYVYQTDLRMMGTMPLWKVDFAAGTLRQLSDIQLGQNYWMEEGNINVLESQEGILLSGENTLWRYNTDTGEREVMISWISPEINIKGSDAIGIQFGDTLEDGSKEFEVLLADWSVVVPEVAKVTYIDQVYVPVRESLVVGASEYSMMEDVVRRFNRSSTQYRVELKKYDTYTMLNDLLFNQEEMPDILDISWIVPDVLAGKGLLENLEPYFKKSKVVKKDDILPAVWEAGLIGGKEVGAVTAFSLQTYWTTDPDFPRDGWNVEDFMNLAQANPDKKMLSTYTPISVMNVFAYTLDAFVDWEKGECSFDSPEFVNLLEQIDSLEFPGEGNNKQTIFYEDEEVRKFLKQEYLLKLDSISAPYYYQQNLDKYKDKAFNIGYPSEEGSQYLMNIRQQFAIYGKSEHKDGAWAFIEFLLSKEEQDWYGDDYAAFPVRKDAFEAYLTRPFSSDSNFKEDNAGAGAEDIAYMVENMYKGDNVRNSEIWTIIWDEVPYLFEGDKSAQEVAELIQNRANVYLKENQ